MLWRFVLQTESRASHLKTGNEGNQEDEFWDQGCSRGGRGQSSSELCPDVSGNHKAAGARAAGMLLGPMALVG